VKLEDTEKAGKPGKGRKGKGKASMAAKKEEP